jgi:type IV secretory pathway VirJ component
MSDRLIAIGLVFWFAAASGAWAQPSSEAYNVPGFGAVTIYSPESSTSEVVLFLSGDGGWNLGVIPMAERLRSLGALVAGIDVRSFIKRLEQTPDCAYPAGELETLSRTIQLKQKLPSYTRPILVGYSSGATLVYAALASAPAETFAGAISLGFCPDVEIHRPLCQMRGLKATARPAGIGYDLAPFKALAPPWMLLQGEIDQVCAPSDTRAFIQDIPTAKLFSLPKVGHGFAVPHNWEPQFIEAYRTVARLKKPRDTAASAPEIRDLSLYEVPAAPSADQHGDVMAIFLTGDGGWAEFDKEVTGALATEGVPVVGWSSLRYFWTPRTAEGAASDLARIIQHYTTSWKRHRVMLIGYSFGADVLPFMVNRLPPDSLAKVQSVALLGLSPTATFEFRISSWLGSDAGAHYRTVPEVERLSVPTKCIHGEDEGDSACMLLKGPTISVIQVGRGHHFSGDYRRIVSVLLGDH